MVVDDIRYKYGMINKPSQEKRLKASHLEKNNIPEEIVKLIEEKEPLSINGTLGSKKGAMPIESENEVARFKKLVVQNREILEKIRIYKLPAIPLGDSECQNRLNNNYQFSFDLDATEYTFLKPTLVLLGRFDTEVGYRDALRVMENYPRATYAILDKAGHSLSWEQPELFTALVRDWLKRVETYVR